MPMWCVDSSATLTKVAVCRRDPLTSRVDNDLSVVRS